MIDEVVDLLLAHPSYTKKDVIDFFEEDKLTAEELKGLMEN